MICKISTAIEDQCSETEKNEAERCDAKIMFGVALSLDSCLAFSVLGLGWVDEKAPLLEWQEIPTRQSW